MRIKRQFGAEERHYPDSFRKGCDDTSQRVLNFFIGDETQRMTRFVAAESKLLSELGFA